MLGEVVPAFERLRQQGKTRFSDSRGRRHAALQQVIDARVFDSAQVVYNMLNPSAASALPANYPAQDYGRLFDRTKAAGIGVIGIRVLAGGALSGSAERHPIASPPPEPIGSAMRYDADVARASRLLPLVTEGFAASLTEAATRFAIYRSGGWHNSGRDGGAATVRGCARRCAKRPAAARRARAADGAAPGICRRAKIVTRVGRARGVSRSTVASSSAAMVKAGVR